MKEIPMKLRLGLAGWILMLAIPLLSATAARADTVLYDAAGFIQGKQSFTESFDISTAGTLTVTLSNIPWLDTLSDLTCFLTTSGGVLGTSMGSGSEQIKVGPGTIFAHWFGDADGKYDIGVFGMRVEFQPAVAAVGLPPSLLLMLSSLGLLFGWQRQKDYARAAG
jgi:hypothetical protein